MGDLGSIPGSGMRETWVQSLGQKDPLQKEMATHSSNLAWKIPWTEKPGGLYSSWGRKESDTTERLHFHFHFLVGLWFILVNFCGRNDFCLSPFSIMLAVSFFFNTIILLFTMLRSFPFISSLLIAFIMKRI